MKSIKVILGIIILLVLCYVGYFAFGYFEYYRRLKREEDKWMNEVFGPRYFKGIIHQLEKNMGGNCFSNLIVSIGKEKFSSGVCLCGKNKDFSSFASEGDTFIKKMNSFKVIIVKKETGITREFDFPFCD